MVTRNPGVHLLRVGSFIPSFTKVSAPSNHLVGLGISEPTSKPYKKNGNSKKRRRKVNPGKKNFPRPQWCVEIPSTHFPSLAVSSSSLLEPPGVFQQIKNPFFPSHPIKAHLYQKNNKTITGGGGLLYLELVFKLFTHFTDSLWDLHSHFWNLAANPTSERKYFCKVSTGFTALNRTRK